MKNMKIKTYKFKKNLVLNKDSIGKFNLGDMEKGTNLNNNNLLREGSLTNRIQQSSNNNFTSTKNKAEYATSKVLSDVERILKTPGLNISVNNEKGNLKYNSKNSESIFDKIGATNDNKINIKLNINSEVINNNIRINQKNEKSLDLITPNSSRGLKNYDYYEELIKEKDKIIESLKVELNNANAIINKIKKSPNSFDMNEERLKKTSSIINSNNAVLTTTMKNQNLNTERKSLLTLDLSKQIMKQNTDFNTEMFSDRSVKNPSNSLFKLFNPMAENASNARNTHFANNVSSLFRQNNKSTSINKYNESAKKNLNGLFNSERKNSLVSNSKAKDAKPIDEVLKSTIAIFDINKTKEESLKKGDITIIEVNENLKLIKSRTQKVLNLYSDFILSKTKLQNVN